jgi:hypothetical protein
MLADRVLVWFVGMCPSMRHTAVWVAVLCSGRWWSFVPGRCSQRLSSSSQFELLVLTTVQFGLAVRCAGFFVDTFYQTYTTFGFSGPMHVGCPGSCHTYACMVWRAWLMRRWDGTMRTLHHGDCCAFGVHIRVWVWLHHSIPAFSAQPCLQEFRQGRGAVLGFKARGFSSRRYFRAADFPKQPRGFG